MMNKPSRTGVAHVLDAYRYSLKGLRAAWRHEVAFRQEIALAALLLPLSLWLGTNASERALLIGSVVIVIVVELLNSAIEAIVDRISTELHPLSGQAKDLGSAAVMLSMLLCLSCWVMIAVQRLL
ncbi:diacylglycerol kinase [Zhongshania aliphaticivorans]|uniref:Diacylglycerol kinase n=1 Tax=Zhongshania aliphaticivorans TaxID=1470434 RepID=A0A127M1X6_9GAMM|nr:diacylglycerol kinase [Zhongshania aliphaticivorans]